MYAIYNNKIYFCSIQLYVYIILYDKVYKTEYFPFCFQFKLTLAYMLKIKNMFFKIKFKIFISDGRQN